ncbi:hypothetical protein SAMN05216573_107194 [Bradyrhizobium sp. Rc3b]|nr:hypothetical protein [Bradyrhizobium sp. Rc3b]SFN04085.1 hypothetical protein SAMN05216573_107194 [Bradyrhizobium sp. Rc3b]
MNGRDAAGLSPFEAFATLRHLRVTMKQLRLLLGFVIASAKARSSP